jgi:hypothetical protein
MLIPTVIRRAVSLFLALLGAVALVLARVELAHARQGSGRAWLALLALVAVAIVLFWSAFRFGRLPPSAGVLTGHVVLFETPMPGNTVSDTPALTIRGARDAIERFIPLAEFGALFGGYALWRAPAHPTPELPGEALGVWGRRLCKRFRRILRERGATVDVRHEPGPAQSIARLVQATPQRS